MNYNPSFVMVNKAKSSYLSALDDFKNKRFDRCVSSLYYSCFQMVVSLMIHRKVPVTKHTYVRTYVNRNLVLLDKLPVGLGKMYNDLMDKRSDADYSPFVEFSEEDVGALLENVNKFNKAVEDILHRDLKVMGIFDQP